ncbi:DUF192 domain-containing protein [Nitratireductor sp. CH_MIT9313-5]|jgi:uncharacterized membrane protein (UPF0127 family)|uniref:DUF192 domain-containing protein n=1 Tax=Nitratireductor sp. CH_MIT9313-5 TaxID=3107764 RepID=UPI00300844B5
MTVARLLAFLLLFIGSFNFALAQEPMLLPVDATPLSILSSNGRHSFQIEVADEPLERQRGLMHREKMSDDRGMLFVFDNDGRRSFWMQNTPLPLDLLFISSSGRIEAIEQGEPFSTASIAPDVTARFVLELNAGTAQKLGIEVGDQVEHPILQHQVKTKKQ